MCVSEQSSLSFVVNNQTPQEQSRNFVLCRFLLRLRLLVEKGIGWCWAATWPISHGMGSPLCSLIRLSMGAPVRPSSALISSMHLSGRSSTHVLLLSLWLSVLVLVDRRGASRRGCS